MLLLHAEYGSGVIGEQKRNAILRYIYDYQKERMYAPSIKEIAKEVDLSTNNIGYHMRILIDEGRIENDTDPKDRVPMESRAYRVSKEIRAKFVFEDM